jgi:SAM-dependent methyltransferase
LIGLTFEALFASLRFRNIAPLIGFFKGLNSGINHKIEEISNLHLSTVESFGYEWEHFDQSTLNESEKNIIFQDYFGIFPWDILPNNANGFDLGCGSGRWAEIVSEKVGHLYCIDPSEKALSVAKRNLSNKKNVDFILASVDSIPIADNSQDFGYSLGVLHHIPDTSSALKSCTQKLKSGAPFLVYLYYALDNRSCLYRALWYMTDVIRRLICTLPEKLKRRATDLIALTVYFTFARACLLLKLFGVNTSQIPLSYYSNKSFYTMRTDARDRFGTILEKRFNRKEIKEIMYDAGLEKVQFSEGVPYWCVIGIKK